MAGLIEDYALIGDMQSAALIGRDGSVGRLCLPRLAHRAKFTVSADEQVPFVLTWMPSHESGPDRVDALDALAETRRFWQDWAARRTYQGLHREAVMRSLITLKALTHEPAGGMVAAATTSLPEDIGGYRNWDHRCCWLRDATITLEALLRTGYTEEALAWLERAVAEDPRDLQIMYGAVGERRLPEWHAPGYRRRPAGRKPSPAGPGHR